MESEEKNRVLPFLVKAGLFIVAIVLIIQLFPRENKFNYYYQNGKPWQNDLLTAPFDFPIYKEEGQLKKERDSLLRGVLPYFDYQATIGKEEINKFKANFPVRKTDDYSNNISNIYRNYIAKKLDECYKTGIVSHDDFVRLNEEGKTQLKLIHEQYSSTIDVAKLLTTKSAYNNIVNSVPKGLDFQLLKSYNIDNYLTENLFYNEKKTELAREEATKNISTTSGIVQTNERIIDKGVVINDHTFRILNSLKKETESRVLSGNKHVMTLLGQILLVTTLMLMLFLFLMLFRPQTFANMRRVTFILLILLMIISLSSVIVKFTQLSIYIVPFALLPIIVRIFFDSRTALFVHIVTVLLISFMVANPFEFVLLQITAGMVTVSSLKDLTQRSQLVQVSALIVLSYSVIYFSYSLISNGNIENMNWHTFLYFVVSGLLLLFAYGLIYIFEKLFGFMSTITLVELSNVNSPLMMRFSESAPGTFQHSLQVASLATEAAAKINANPLLVRVGALYHDIGKMTNPMYFIENQGGRPNPLSELDYEKAAKIIINHVAEGVKIAHKYNLPQQVIDFIQTHHAQSKTLFFYNSFKNEYPDRKINEEAFTYPGPKPWSKEMAILMMADSVEAASRSLPEYTEDAIDKMVETIIDRQITEGSFKNVPITFQHIEKIKELFKAKLKNMHHSRINYPELNTGSK